MEENDQRSAESTAEEPQILDFNTVLARTLKRLPHTLEALERIRSGHSTLEARDVARKAAQIAINNSGEDAEAVGLNVEMVMAGVRAGSYDRDYEDEEASVVRIYVEMELARRTRP